MSTLTKVFVVMLAIGSIAFTTVAVSISAQTTNWRTTAESYRNQLAVAETTLRGLTAAHAAQVATQRDTINGQLSRIAELEGQLATARQDVGQKDLALKQAIAEKGNQEAMNRGLLGQLSVSQANEESFRKQRDDLEKSNLDLQTRNMHLLERVHDQTSQIAVLVEQRRQFEQQLDILKRENTTLSRQASRPGAASTLEDPKGAGLSQVTAVTPVASSAVRGRVLRVDGNIVTLSVGSADGVERDMVFVVRRAGEYVGDVTISVVEPNQSAGRLTRHRVVPAADDEVIDLSHLASTQG
ncbi:MAG: hypothetical protein FLDDKLPJ_01007 [Phycisphaerae bacterium]|nr:hypothetical protein [Phycisphaerae bacterium]